jgi:glycosyltransferase involved in cell wall biosynthesis
MCAADVLSMPSRWEGLGGALIEAMALGLPVVASNIPPIVEALGDAAAALVPPDDPRSLARALDEVLDGGPQVEQCARNGVARFAQHYEVTSVAKEMVQLYRAVAASPNRPRDSQSIIGHPASCEEDAIRTVVKRTSQVGL